MPPRYYHGAEFYLPAGEARNGLYDDFTRTWALSMKGVAGVRAHRGPLSRRALAGFSGAGQRERDQHVHLPRRLRFVRRRVLRVPDTAD